MSDRRPPRHLLHVRRCSTHLVTVPVSIGTLLIGLMVSPAAAQAQVTPPAPSSAAPAGPPDADIYLARLDRRGRRSEIGGVTNVTARAGYDNQPSFTADGRAILYTSQRDGQTDIYRYDILSHATSAVTTTSESEYSPTVTPDQRWMSVIRVESDSTQRLWRFPLDGGDPALVLERVKPVGYHAWADDRTLVLFVLGTPATLQVADARTGDSRVVWRNPGRGIQRVRGSSASQGGISFVDKTDSTSWWIIQLDPRHDRTRRIAPTLAGSEDYAWTPQGTLLMASGRVIYELDPRNETSWRAIATVDDAAIKSITRLAVSPKGDWIALVGNH